MSYKVFISDGTLLKECIKDVAFNIDPINFLDMRTGTANSMIIKGKIDTAEGTAKLYKWAMLAGNDSNCYKEVTVELIKDSQLMRKVSFSKAFVVDYSEEYSNHVGVGTFTLYIKQFLGEDIECIGPTDKPSEVDMSAVEKVEEVVEEARKLSPIVEKVTKEKSVMRITDRLAKQKKIGDNIAAGENVKTLVIEGQQFTNGRKNKLKPNIKYKTGEYDYFYETDDAGRITKFETDKLQLTKRKDRLPHSKNTPGKIKGKDDAGHLAGDRFGGSPKIDNLVSQLSDVNKKQYKKIENKWAKALNGKPPKEVKATVEVIYSGKDMRPDKFLVKYTIDGKPGSAVFKN